MPTFADNVIDYHFSLSPDWTIPNDISIIYPFDDEQVGLVFKSFYKKYFDDQERRVFLFGINPGRFGAGITGIPFTDPKILEEECDIANTFEKRNEISSIFIYDLIRAFGGPRAFYTQFYITSVCPLGFLKQDKNYNYYDDNQLKKATETYIIDNIQTQLSFGANRQTAFSIGKGKNFKYLKEINAKHQFFKKIEPLPHPRWVMQYNLKSKDLHINKCIELLSTSLIDH